ncbi:hypothetical protein K1719_038651 [Acacia pycnantha]|nr:hypothetical protein K1719_038651 [Acacia pycnantha]
MLGLWMTALVRKKGGFLVGNIHLGSLNARGATLAALIFDNDSLSCHRGIKAWEVELELESIVQCVSGTHDFSVSSFLPGFAVRGRKLCLWNFEVIILLLFCLVDLCSHDVFQRYLAPTDTLSFISKLDAPPLLHSPWMSAESMLDLPSFKLIQKILVLEPNKSMRPVN